MKLTGGCVGGQMNERQIARDITYANSASSRGGRAVIRVMENVTGRLKLIRKVRGYSDEVAEAQEWVLKGNEEVSAATVSYKKK